MTGDENRFRQALAAWLVLVCAVFTTASAQAIESAITLFDTLPPARADYRRPSDKDLLFYIQRSNNNNTVVYVARREADGTLDRNSPVDVFWRHFAGDGARGELSYLEKVMAFGVEVRPLASASTEFSVNLAAYSERTAVLKLADNNSLIMVTKIADHNVKLNYAYINFTGNLYIPNIKYIDIVGQDIDSGKYIRERITLSKAMQRQGSRK